MQCGDDLDCKFHPQGSFGPEADILGPTSCCPNRVWASRPDWEDTLPVHPCQWYGDNPVDYFLWYWWLYPRCTWDFPTSRCFTRARRAQDTIGGWQGITDITTFLNKVFSVAFIITGIITFFNMFSSSSASPLVIHRPPQHVIGQGAGSGFSPMLPLCTTGRESYHHHHHHHNYHSNPQI